MKVLLVTLLSCGPALMLGQAGRIGINTSSPMATLHVADSTVLFTGVLPLPAAAPSPISGDGVGMMWYPSKGAFRTGLALSGGWSKDNIGTYSFAAGANTRASGFSSHAIGHYATATAEYSIALGAYTRATDSYAVAIGDGAEATREFSVAIGFNALTRGANTIALGDNVTAKPYKSVVVGTYNDTTTTSVFSWVPTDPIFIVGNGTFETRTNAMTVLKNGRVGIGAIQPVTKLHITGGDDASYSTNSGYLVTGGINGDNVVIDENEILARSNGAASILYLQKEGGNLGLCEAGGNVGIGPANPLTRLHITGGTDATYASGSGYAVFGGTSGLNIVFDENEILARSNGSPSTLHMQISGGNISLCEGGGNTGIGVPNPLHKLHVSGNGFFTGTVTASCGVLSCSDMRYKKNVVPITHALERIQKLHGIYYNWDTEEFADRGFDNRRQIGMSAQQLEAEFPELVYTDEAGYKTVDYSRLGPVLLEAIKEQQATIELLTSSIEALSRRLDEQAEAVHVND